MTQKTARGSRLVIALAGRRNVGKSSLINAICGEEIAIVSATAGTTTDPVAKAYELLPVGPVTFYDTAGLDDLGEVGEKRIKATKKILLRADMALVVIDDQGVTDADKELLTHIKELNIPALIALNKTDKAAPSPDTLAFIEENDLTAIPVSAQTGDNVQTFKEALIKSVPEEFKKDPVLASDLFVEGDQIVCVTPIDLAAPKGRLIVPQVQVIREILDSDATAIVVKERELEPTLDNMKNPPALVITDSQVVLKVSADVPEDVPLTTFSMLFARFKGDLELMVDGANAIDKLKDGDKVLVGEACSHHVQSDDIGRVKIPRWLMQYTGRDLEFDTASGHDFPDNLSDYSLVIHCGSCMLNRVEMLRRLRACKRSGVPVTNYGVAISKLQGVLDRTVKPFFG